jgi:hypothetical protein
MELQNNREVNLKLRSPVNFIQFDVNTLYSQVINIILGLTVYRDAIAARIYLRYARSVAYRDTNYYSFQIGGVMMTYV